MLSAGEQEVSSDPGAEVHTRTHTRTHCPLFKLVHKCKVCVCVMSPVTSHMRRCLGNRLLQQSEGVFAVSSVCVCAVTAVAVGTVLPVEASAGLASVRWSSTLFGRFR